MAEPAKRRREEKRPSTRSTAEHYLIGNAASGITGAKLPTLRQVLQYLIYLKDITPHSTSTASCIKQAVAEVIPFWLMAGIKTILVQNVEKKLERIWNERISLKKSINKVSDLEEKKRKTFVDKLDKLWDIGAKDAVQVIQQNKFLTTEKKTEDISFYRDQQNQRLGRMSGRDKIYAAKIKEKTTRLQRAESYRAKYTQQDMSEDEEELSSSSQQSDSTDSSTVLMPEMIIRNEYVMLEAPRNLIDHKEVSAALDRLKLSDNASTMLIASFIKACGGDINEFSLSRSTTHRARVANRFQISHEIMTTFIESPPQNIALHWDGKLTEDRFGSKYEALTVIVTGSQNFTDGKILGVQKLERATGKAQAEASFQMLQLWQLDDKVRALVFDTTASNSGWKNGAAKILEELLGRKLFYNACRHHVYELVVGAVWKCLFGKTTTGPENTLFNQFKSKWSSIDKTETFKVLEVPGSLNEQKLQVLEELSVLVNKHNFLRDDYKQCATNTLAILGGTPQGDASHHKPGATHSARWMGTILYCQKMFMWSEQMAYSDELIELLSRMNLFLSLFYVPAWLKSSIGSDAAINDLKFINDMHDFRVVDACVADAALKKIRSHHWYLNEETVVFSLFSENPYMTYDRKSDMANCMLSTPTPEHFRQGVPVLRKPIYRSTSLSDLIGPESWFIFNALQVSSDWLKQHPSHWDSCEAYRLLKSFVHKIKVVNDAAERGVKLNTDYATILTDNEEQRAGILQAVEKHRKDFPDFRKSTLSK